MATFYYYFRENMQALGLPAPDSLFGNLQLALGTAATLVNHIEKFGKRVTVRELIVAGLRSEKLAVVASLSAAYYTGAVIGSIAIASGRTISGGRSMADVLWDARQNGLHRPWLHEIMRRHPIIYDKTVTGRGSVGSRMIR
ncbi:hypothetical protein ACFFKC_21660 [Pseudoduganella danionis]|uniref:DUF697 domain-containing protein n=1 Tax=Pseudoduganella danionis TaxID=1890295 RepID=A0ABW9STS4_9BURK|nr:hypothetical protein [Pseudoduganella danionis]MTW35235.1 hypothetical protein [Pseudoduganella danionis]